MRKVFLFLVFLLSVVHVFGQDWQGNRVLVKDGIYIKNYGLNNVINDTSQLATIDSSRSVMTSKAVYAAIRRYANSGGGSIVTVPRIKRIGNGIYSEVIGDSVQVNLNGPLTDDINLTGPHQFNLEANGVNITSNLSPLVFHSNPSTLGDAMSFNTEGAIGFSAMDGIVFYNPISVTTSGSEGTGDLYYRGADGFLNKISIGSNGQGLEVVAGLPAWKNKSIGTSEWVKINDSIKIKLDSMLSSPGNVLRTSPEILIDTTGGRDSMFIDRDLVAFWDELGDSLNNHRVRLDTVESRMANTDFFIRSTPLDGTAQTANIHITGGFKTRRMVLGTGSMYEQSEIYPNTTYRGILSGISGNTFLALNTDGNNNGDGTGVRFNNNNVLKSQIMQFGSKTPTWGRNALIMGTNAMPIDSGGMVRIYSTSSYVALATISNIGTSERLKVFNNGNTIISNSAGTDVADDARLKIIAIGVNGNRAINATGSAHISDTITTASVLAAGDSSNRIPTTAWIKRYGASLPGGSGSPYTFNNGLRNIGGVVGLGGRLEEEVTFKGREDYEYSSHVTWDSITQFDVLAKTRIKLTSKPEGFNTRHSITVGDKDDAQYLTIKSHNESSGDISNIDINPAEIKINTTELFLPGVVGAGSSGAANDSMLVINPSDGGIRYKKIPVVGGASLQIGSSPISSGTDGRMLYDNAGVLGEKAVTGTGDAVLANSPTFTGNPIVPTQTFGVGNTRAANTYFVNQSIQNYSTFEATNNPSGSTLTVAYSAFRNIINAQNLSVNITSILGTSAAPFSNSIIFIFSDNGTARSIAGWDSNYRTGDIPLPTTTIVGKVLYYHFTFNMVDNKWDLVGLTSINK